jgi:hypothetical protein
MKPQFYVIKISGEGTYTSIGTYNRESTSMEKVPTGSLSTTVCPMISTV